MNRITPNPSDPMTDEQRQQIVDLLNTGLTPSNIFCFHYLPLEYAVQVEKELSEIREIELNVSN